MAELVVAPDARRRGIGYGDGECGACRVRRRHPRLGARQSRAGACDRRGVRRQAGSRAVADAPLAACSAAGGDPGGHRTAHLPWYSGRRRAAAGQQRRVRVAPRAGCGSRRTISPSAGPSPGSTLPGCSWRSTNAPTSSLGFHWTKVHSDRRGSRRGVCARRRSGRAGPWAGARADPGRSALPRRAAVAAHPDPAVMLYTEADNTAAVRTYQALGSRVRS